MSVTLRLYRLGKLKEPHYRVVAIDKRKKRNGTYIDVLGHYNPTDPDRILELDETKVTMWLEKGATMSEGFSKLLKMRKRTS